MKLAIFKVNQLGDNVIFLPVIQALRRQYPQWELFLITSPVAAELFAADIPAARLLAIPTREFNGAWKHPRILLKLAARLRRERVDASLLGNDQGNVAHLLALLAGGRTRVGIRPPFIKLPGGLTDIVPLPLEMKVAQANWEIARALVERCGGKVWAETPPPPDLSHLTGDAAPVAGRVVIHAGASLAYKRWFPDRFHTLANRLAEACEVLWIEQPDTAGAELSTAVQRVAPDSLGAFVRTLRTASLFVGNNSGPMHLASALGCPSVIISGPSHPVWDPMWFPERFLVLRDSTLACLPCDGLVRPAGVCQNVAAPLACMARWSVEDVEARCHEWLAQWAGIGQRGDR